MTKLIYKQILLHLCHLFEKLKLKVLQFFGLEEMETYY